MFTASKVFVLTSAKKAVYLKPLQSLDSLPAPLEIIERQKSESQTDKVNVLVASVKAAVKDIVTLLLVEKPNTRPCAEINWHAAQGDVQGHTPDRLPQRHPVQRDQWC